MAEVSLLNLPLDELLLGWTDDKSTLVQVMAWCWQATSHYLSQCWPRMVDLCRRRAPLGHNKLNNKVVPLSISELWGSALDHWPAGHCHRSHLWHFDPIKNSMKLHYALVHNIFVRSKQNFLQLSWRMQNFFVIGLAHFKPEYCNFFIEFFSRSKYH